MARAIPIRPAAMAAAGWERTDGTKGKLAARWRHRSGWRLEHCGHPTALTPWQLFDPAGRHILTGVAGEARNPEFGTAWPSLRRAVEWLSSTGVR